MKKKMLILGGTVAFLLVAITLYQYNKPHRNVDAEEASYQLTADEIYLEFVTDQQAAYQKYNETVVEFSGIISKLQQKDGGTFNLLLKGKEGVISCEMSADFSPQPLKENETVKLKGLFIDFDDLLGELQFKHCSIIKE